VKIEYAFLLAIQYRITMGPVHLLQQIYVGLVGSSSVSETSWVKQYSTARLGLPIPIIQQHPWEVCEKKMMQRQALSNAREGVRHAWAMHDAGYK